MLSLLADVLVVAHFGFTTFVIFGGFLTWRWPRLAWLHLPALAWGCWVEVSSAICPLTPLENTLRHRGGEAGYSGGFLAHYLAGILYPAGLTAHIQWLLAAFLVALNVAAYVGLWRRRGRGAPIAT
jgi:Protein of Unknown function (DUF2784)